MTASTSFPRRSVIDSTMTELILFLVFALLVVLQIFTDDTRKADKARTDAEREVAALTEMAVVAGDAVQRIAPGLVRLDLPVQPGATARERLAAVEAFLKALDQVAASPEVARALQRQTLADIVKERDQLRKQRRPRPSELAAEIKRLEKELAHRGERIAALEAVIKDATGKGGFDRPACWLDDGNSPEPLLVAEVHDDGIKISQAWSQARAEKARDLPLPDFWGRMVTAAEFRAAFKALDAATRKEGCVHYAVIKDRWSTRDRGFANREAVQSVFYPLRGRSGS